MSVRVNCPSCEKELSAPAELMGKMVSCPRCHRHFPIPAAAADGDLASAGSPGESPEPHAVDAPEPPDGGDAEKASPNRRSGRKSRSGSAKAKMPVAPRRKISASDSAASLPRQAPPSQKRVARTAKFVAAEPSAARIDLGADGQLPQLVLTDEAAKREVADEETPEEQGQSYRPFLLVGVFCFSICLSVVMLMLDSGVGSTDSGSKAEARRMVEEYYTGKPIQPTAADDDADEGSEPSTGSSPLRPYQTLLRQALQAHNRGDYAAEQRLYRKVLDMLHAEGKNPFRGLTDRVQGPTPSPANRRGNDAHLEELLSTLLSKD